MNSLHYFESKLNRPFVCQFCANASYAIRRIAKVLAEGYTEGFQQL